MYSNFHHGENETEIKQVKKFYEFQPMLFLRDWLLGSWKRKLYFLDSDKFRAVIHH
jgi:hypothetical protein